MCRRFYLSYPELLAIRELTDSSITDSLVASCKFQRQEINRIAGHTERGKEFRLRTPMRRFGQLDELAGAAVFLASDAASYVTGHVPR